MSLMDTKVMEPAARVPILAPQLTSCLTLDMITSLNLSFLIFMVGTIRWRIVEK